MTQPTTPTATAAATAEDLPNEDWLKHVSSAEAEVCVIPVGEGLRVQILSWCRWCTDPPPPKVGALLTQALIWSEQIEDNAAPTSSQTIEYPTPLMIRTSVRVWWGPQGDAMSDGEHIIHAAAVHFCGSLSLYRRHRLKPTTMIELFMKPPGVTRASV